MYFTDLHQCAKLKCRQLTAKVPAARPLGIPDATRAWHLLIQYVRRAARNIYFIISLAITPDPTAPKEPQSQHPPVA